MNTASSSSSYAAGGLASLEDIVAQIANSNEARSLNQYLKSFAPKDVRDTILASTLPGGQDPLSLLDPEMNTLGVLYILSARLHSTTTPSPSLEVIEAFCSRFKPEQARMAPDRVTSLAKGIVRAARSSSNPKYALAPLFNLATRYPPNLSYLTTLHPLLLELCVETRHFSAALPLLSVPITTVDTTLSELHYNDNLIYHYSGGVALAALKRWREAEEYFEICVSAPAQVPAAIQLEAYKKLVLVQLILYGETVNPPKYTLPSLTRLIKSSPYGAFVKAYPQSVANLRKLVEKEKDTFSTERNLGLINQAIERAPVWLIKKLTATYLTLGLSDIGREVGITDEESLRSIILSMMDTGEISATISADSTVTFSDAVAHFSKGDLDKMVQKAQEQSRLLHELERQMNTSRDYLNKAVKHKDDAGWVPEEESMFAATAGGMGSSQGMWADDNYA